MRAPLALRYVQGESEAAYVTRITTTLRSTIRDANVHFVNASTSFDYTQSDNTHPTYTGATIDRGAGPAMHILGAAFRSIETRRPQLRATNTGISAVIDPSGEVTGRIEPHRRGTLVATVHPEAARWTPMLSWGDWLGPVALVAGVVLLARGGVVGPRLV